MYKKITVGAFIASLVMFFALIFIFPRDEMAQIKENRPLSEMPSVSISSILSGEFMEKYEQYLSDNVGFRSFFTDLGARIEGLRGITQGKDGQVITLANGSRLAVYRGKIMEIFRSDEAAKQAYINAINSYADILPEKTNMYVMIVPTQIEFDNSQYATLSDDQKATIDSIYSSLTHAKGIDVYSKLAEHTDEYIYFRTDHHWTQRGAYYGYLAIAEKIGEKAIPITEMERGKASGFLGYLYNQANIPDLASSPDDIEYFIPGENYTLEARISEFGEIADYSARIYNIPKNAEEVRYAVFMGGDHPFAKITTANKNGKCALIIKDSYANALIPLLTSHYETLLVIDPRSYYASVTELFSEYEIDDLFVINYTVATILPSFIESLEKIK